VVALSTECVDLGPLGVPFGPVPTILRQLVVAVGADAVLAAAGAGLPALLAVLPELSPIVSNASRSVMSRCTRRWQRCSNGSAARLGDTFGV
jgi:hypothetical protein